MRYPQSIYVNFHSFSWRKIYNIRHITRKQKEISYHCTIVFQVTRKMALGAWNSAKEILFTEIPYLTSAVVQTILSTFFKPLKSNFHLPVLERIAQNTLKNPVDGSVRKLITIIPFIELLKP